MFGLFKRKPKEEVIPPRPQPQSPLQKAAVAFPSGEEVLYKMKYQGFDINGQRQRRLIQLRRRIKDNVVEARSATFSKNLRKQIHKEERDHWRKAKNRLFDIMEINSIFSDNDNADNYFRSQQQRHLFLAYGFLRGKRYSEIENAPRWKHPLVIPVLRIKNLDGKHDHKRTHVKNRDRAEPNWPHVAELIFQYGNFDKNLLSTEELRVAREELLNRLRVWAGN